MGGRRAKHPVRPKKFVDKSKFITFKQDEAEKQAAISEEEHQKRIEMLKSMGLLK